MASIALARGARIALRGLTKVDIDPFHRIITDPAIARMLFIFNEDWTLDDVAKFFEDTKYADQPPFRLAVVDNTGAFIGSVGIAPGQEPEIFYFFTPESGGQGYGTETVGVFTRWLFETFEMPALKAQAFQDNPASDRVLSKCSFVRIGEGKMTSAARSGKSPVWRYSLTREDIES